MSSGFPLIFDGHNDTVMQLVRGERSFFEKSEKGHIDLPRAREGGLIGGFFAVYITDPNVAQIMDQARAEGRDPREALEQYVDQYADPANWPDPMPLDYAQTNALTMLGTLFQVERQSEGQVKIIRTAAELEQCIADGTFAIELHFEGAEPLDPGGDALEVFYAAGLRSVGLTHSRRNIFTEGVPFKFPASPDTGPGLNDLGKELVRQLNRKKIMIDLSHITEQGFWDVAALTDAPLVATHSNAWNLSNTPRNLTDRQMDAIKESNGVAGLNFHVGFLREDGANDADTPISVMADHVDYMVDKMGIDCVALGSDFDGATMPAELKDCAGLPKLMQALADRGYSTADLTKLAHANWVRVLRETWGE
jgi:membrane dipeptidase